MGDWTPWGKPSGTEIMISHWEVKSTDVIIYDRFYMFLHDFLLEEGYAPSVSDSDFPETYVWETRTNQKGHENWIWWRGKKKVAAFSGGSHEMYRSTSIDLHGVGIKQVEAVYNGTKVKAWAGKIEVIVTAKLVIDARGDFHGGILKPFYDIFFDRLYKKELESQKREVFKDSNKLQTVVKQLFGLPDTPSYQLWEHETGGFAPPG